MFSCLTEHIPYIIIYTPYTWSQYISVLRVPAIKCTRPPKFWNFYGVLKFGEPVPTSPTLMSSNFEEDVKETQWKTTLCSFFCMLGLYIYAIYVGNKFRNDGNLQCKNDGLWLFVFGITAFVNHFNQLISPCFRIESFLFKTISALVALGGLFMLGWSIYGIELFFKEPICAQQEAHLFGKILAWLSVVSYSIMGCMCFCGIPWILANPAAGAEFSAKFASFNGNE